MNNLQTTISVLALATLGACATTTTRRATIAMKVSETEAHVSMGSGEVSVGDHVELFRNVCTQKSAGARGNGAVELCKKVPVGHGDIIQIVNESYSVAKVPSEIQFREGDLVEKHPH